MLYNVILYRYYIYILLCSQFILYSYNNSCTLYRYSTTLLLLVRWNDLSGTYVCIGMRKNRRSFLVFKIVFFQNHIYFYGATVFLRTTLTLESNDFCRRAFAKKKKMVNINYCKIFRY